MDIVHTHTFYNDGQSITYLPFTIINAPLVVDILVVGGGSQLTGAVLTDSQLGGHGGSGIVIVRYPIQGQFRP